MTTRRWRLALGTVLTCALGAAEAQDGAPDLTPCHVSGVAALASCGQVEVPVDWSVEGGASLSLAVAVLPPSGGAAEHAPLYLLAGGPGQAASDLGPLVTAAMRGMREGREVVLVDQRGTGRSAPFGCRGEDLPADIQGAALAEICLASAPGDPAHFTSADFVRDLDAVRADLGHEVVDLWGASYGTRAALRYAKAHPDRVRAMVLDGVAPPSVPIFAGEAGTFGDALQATFDACASDEACAGAFPDLAASFREARNALDAAPVTVRSSVGGEDVEVDGTLFANGLRGALYAPQTAALLPLVLARAAEGELGPWKALAEAGGFGGIDYGLFLSVMCTEEAPRTRGQIAPPDGAFASTFDLSLREACSAWPAAPYPDGFEADVAVPVPTLLLSGALDPITPPASAEAAMRALPNAVHLVAPFAGHGVTAHGCGATLIEDFLAAPGETELDGSCLSEIGRPPFAVSLAGPRP